MVWSLGLGSASYGSKVSSLKKKPDFLGVFFKSIFLFCSTTSNIYGSEVILNEAPSTKNQTSLPDSTVPNEVDLIPKTLVASPVFV